MAAPFYGPGIFWFFLQANLLAHKIPRLRGGGYFGFFWGGGAECQLYFMGAEIFLRSCLSKGVTLHGGV